MRSAHAMLASAILLAAAGLVPDGSAASARASGPAPAILAVEPAAASGVRVFHVENPAGLDVVRYWIDYTWTGDYRPWHVQLLQPDGKVHPFLNLRGTTPDADHASSGRGDGVAYAGGPSGTAQTPGLLTTEEEFHIEWAELLPGKSGHVVVAWANQEDGIRFKLHFPHGTRITPVAEAPLEAFEVKDFGGGARAGVPAAAAASVDDVLALDPSGGQLWGYVFHSTSTSFSRGELTVEREGDGWRRTKTLDATLGADGERICVCSEWGRWVFTSGSRLTVALDLVAEGAHSEVFVVAATLPARTLPDDVWQEFVVTSR